MDKVGSVGVRVGVGAAKVDPLRRDPDLSDEHGWGPRLSVSWLWPREVRRRGNIWFWPVIFAGELLGVNEVL